MCVCVCVLYKAQHDRMLYLKFFLPLAQRLLLAVDVFGEHAGQLSAVLQLGCQSPVILSQQKTSLIHCLRELICCLLICTSHKTRYTNR